MVTALHTHAQCNTPNPKSHSGHVWSLAAAVALCLITNTPAAAFGASSLDSTAEELFQAGDYAAVTALFRTQPPEEALSQRFLRLSLISFVRLGRTNEALPLYERLVPDGKAYEASLLRPLALAVITGHVRDRKEHVRIAAYTALAELGLKETAAILEDGLLDSSPLVRARAAEAIGKAGLAKKSGALRRALGDTMPTVRIAAITALGEANATDLIPQFTKISRAEEGPESIFASVALYHMGQSGRLADITSAATLPDPDMRMAALGVLGRLKRPASLAVLSQAVYDPHPSVRAFAAGALGEFASPGGVAPLIHAIGDESAMVRGIAAGSLGKLGLQENRPLLHGLLRDPSWRVRAGALEGLLRLGDMTALPLAAELAQQPDPSARGIAAKAVSMTSDKQAIAVLERLLKDQQPLPRLMAAMAMGKSGGAVVPLLIKALRDSDEAVRIAAAGSVIRQLDKKQAPPRR